MKLYELLNTKFHISDDDIRMNDDELEIVKSINGKKIRFYASVWHDEWDIEFSAIIEHEGEDFHQYGKTNTGNAPQILSFVIDATLKLIELRHPDKITFLAGKADRSRVTVYERILKKKIVGYKFEKEEIDHIHFKFTMTKE